jgi:predicted metal-dependent hydrolase
MPDPAERRARLSIDVSVATRRRVRLAAARRDQSIRDYVVEALAERLTEDLGDEPLDEAGALTEQADPVLGRLWRNAADSVYDDL